MLVVVAVAWLHSAVILLLDVRGIRRWRRASGLDLYGSLLITSAALLGLIGEYWSWPAIIGDSAIVTAFLFVLAVLVIEAFRPRNPRTRSQ